MKRQTAFERAVDQRVADDSTQYDGLACKANGCPNRWAVDSADRGISKLCSAHAWAEPKHWPRITDEQYQAITEHAAWKASEEYVETAPLSREDKLEILRRLKILQSAL